MTTAPERRTATLTELVAQEIDSVRGRRRMSQAQLAKEMGKTPMWVSLRLRGLQPIDLNDLLLFARALGVQIHDLMPPPDEAARAVTGPSAIPRYLDLPVRIETHTDRPRDNRPSGKAGPSHPIGAARTSYVTRRPRGRRD